MTRGVIQCSQALVATLFFVSVVSCVYLLMASHRGFSSPSDSSDGIRNIFDFSFSDTLSSNNEKIHDRGSSDGENNDSHFDSKPRVTVKTSFGQFRGFTQQVLGKDVHTFLGIPYASPPIGNLRFRKPVPVVPQPKHVFHASNFKSKCVQLQKDVPVFTDVSAGVSEDCLYLNIWTTRINSTTKDHHMPVMIWIYGGGFFMGTSAFDETDGRVLASFTDVVVVTLDYRLGGLGFLDLGTEKEAGNQGLYDQVAAMKWVRDNIRQFGGDPTAVTLFGESAGAMSVGLHILAQESEGLFHRAILQSESPFMTSSFFQRGDKSTPDFVKFLRCTDQDEGYNLICLRRKTVPEIIEATQRMHEKYFFAFPPTAEEEFLPMLPSEFVRLTQAEKADIVNEVPQIMIGNPIRPFSFMLWLAKGEIFATDRVTRSFNTIDQVKDLMLNDISHLLLMPRFQVDFLTRKLFTHLVNVTDPELWLDRLNEVLGDVSFICPSNVLVEQMTGLGKSVYVYEFTHRRKGSPWGLWFRTSLHDEIAFVFGHPLRFPDKYEGSDIDLSKRMMKTWATFAKSGHPDAQLGVDWPPSTPQDRAYIQIDPHSAVVKRNQSRESCETFKLGFELLNK